MPGDSKTFETMPELQGIPQQSENDCVPVQKNGGAKTSRTCKVEASYNVVIQEGKK